ncbi:MAG TPA: hypothetical protein DCL75_13260 [Ktedonobacter sp.]|nr:hypothetical protein [Ktedonobacter sp.]HCJ35859.1 hypothetical protein [Ktedonobacter sp.]
MCSARIYITTKGHIIMLLNVAFSHVIREGSTLPMPSHAERERYVFPKENEHLPGYGLFSRAS